jgi:hypothetical protein
LSTGAASITGTLAVSSGITSTGTNTMLSASSSTQGLVVRGGSSIGAASTASGQILIGQTATYRGSIAYDDNAGYLYIDNLYNNNAGNIYFRTKTTGTPVEALTILGSGNVGIGTSTPSGKLHVSSTGDTYFVLTGGSTPLSYSFLVDANDMRLFTGVGDSEKLRVTSSYLRLASGMGGIQFNGDTAAANALDDYEEGDITFAITFGGGSSGITYARNTGKYTKVGRQVTITGAIELTSKGTSTGNAVLTGLPFAVPNSIPHFATVALSNVRAITFADQIQAYVLINTSTVILNETTNAGAYTQLTDSDFANNSEFVINCSYFV